MDGWGSELVDVQSFSKHNDKYRYLLTVTDVFTKYIHVVPLHSKTGTAVASAFQSIFNDSRYTTKDYKRRRVWLRTDKGKEFVNRTVQEMLSHEGIQFQV